MCVFFSTKNAQQISATLEENMEGLLVQHAKTVQQISATATDGQKFVNNLHKDRIHADMKVLAIQKSIAKGKEQRDKLVQ